MKFKDELKLANQLLGYLTITLVVIWIIKLLSMLIVWWVVVPATLWLVSKVVLNWFEDS